MGKTEYRASGLGIGLGRGIQHRGCDENTQREGDEHGEVVAGRNLDFEMGMNFGRQNRIPS